MAKRFKIKRIVKFAVKEYITVVDDQDAHLLRSYHWTVTMDQSKPDEKGNPRCYVLRTFKSERIMLHHAIVGAKPGEKVWHINGDTMDNRRSNLLLRGAAEELVDGPLGNGPQKY